MSNVATQSFQLPSKGVLYGESLPEGRVTLTRMTAYDQSLLFSQGSTEDRITKLIQNCVKLPKELPASKLLTVDRMAILLVLRTLTFGATYDFGYVCAACRSQQRHTVNIVDDLNDIVPEGVMEEPFAIDLPDGGQKVALRFIRGEDEDAIAKHTKRVAMQSVDASDSSSLYRLARLVVSVDGEELDIVKREKFIRELSARDANVIEDEVAAREPGVDLTVTPECKKCEHVNDLKMPFDRDFFRPTSVRAKPT